MLVLLRGPHLMEGSGGFGFPFGGDPEDLMRGLREFAEQQAETVQEAQRGQFATLTLNTAVELTAAALAQLQPQGSIDEQAIALRTELGVPDAELGSLRGRAGVRLAVAGRRSQGRSEAKRGGPLRASSLAPIRSTSCCSMPTSAV